MHDESITRPTPDGYLQQSSGMTNKYRVHGKTTTILIERRNGTIHRMTIDTADLPRVLALPGTISLTASSTHPDTFYAIITLNKRQIRFHRWLTNVPDGYEIDHLNHDPLDQRRANLRVTDRSGNSANRRTKTWTLQKGVLKSTRRDRWAAFVWLGEFEHEADAELVYDEALAILKREDFWGWIHERTEAQRLSQSETQPERDPGNSEDRAA